MPLYENDSEVQKETYYAQLRTIGINANAVMEFFTDSHAVAAAL